MVWRNYVTVTLCILVCSACISLSKSLCSEWQMRDGHVHRVTTYAPPGERLRQWRNLNRTRMWVSAQRDGRPAENRWRSLFTPQSFADAHYRVPCSNAAKTQNPLKLAGVPKTTGPILAASGPLVGRRSPYCKDMWRRWCCLTSFFSDCRYVPIVAKI